ncbi:MAG: tyrosine-type recombinase/integrase [Desulfobacterales bacterium]|nr:tyrosine-type recombinase/integrase [Desulfobacterales bacterium]
MNEVDAVKSKDDIQRIENLLLKHGSQDYADIWKLGINVAFRISDLLDIEYSNINMNTREYTTKEQKTGKSRTVRFNNSALAIIERRREDRPDDKFLFQSQSKRIKCDHLKRETVARKFKEIGDIVDIKLSTHSMRKTRGYIMHSSGVSIEQISEVLNHSSPAVTMAYIGLTKEATLKTYDEFEL